MAARTPSCPKCNASMTEGFVLDVSYGTRKPNLWVEGKPEKSFWVGVKLANRRQIEISAFRCSSCGFLETYARQ